MAGRWQSSATSVCGSRPGTRRAFRNATSRLATCCARRSTRRWLTPCPLRHRTSGITLKHLSLEEAVDLREQYRSRGLSVVWTNGCFDLLHMGHVQSFEAARAQGHVLFVGLNSDGSVRALEASRRPDVSRRASGWSRGIAGCRRSRGRFRRGHSRAHAGTPPADVHCKGADYAPPNGAPIPEAKLIESYGGRLAFLPLVPGLSTTAVLDRLATKRPQ